MKLHFDKVTIFGILKYLATLFLALIAGFFVYSFIEGFMTFDAMNSLSILAITFILGLCLKVSYTNLVFVIDLLAGVALVSLYSFGEGLIIILIALLLQRVLKII